jgi:hypothetical protein
MAGRAYCGRRLRCEWNDLADRNLSRSQLNFWPYALARLLPADPNPLQASGLHPALPACARRPAPIKHGRHMQVACPTRRPKLAVDDRGNDAQRRRIRLDDRCGFGGLDRSRGEIFESWRVVQAIGVCASSVLSRAIARDLFSGNELGRVLSFVMVAMASIRQTNARAKNPARPIGTA